MSIFDEIAKKYHWELQGKPVRLNGGFMHRVYKLDTSQGSYVLKLLNPFVMQRETAMENYSKAERLELLLEQHDLPILPALSFGGKKMQKAEDKYFYLFDYFPGRALKNNEITDYHCREMGKVLAEIHSIDKKRRNEPLFELSIDWEFYLAEMKRADPGLYTKLKDVFPVITDSQTKRNLSRKKLPQTLSICHNDMDRKNVLWNGQDYRIIDLECLSYNNPFMELFESALCWSGYESCQIDFRLFQAFLQGYQNAGGELPADWETLYECNNGRLEWLEYNMKRVLGIGCGADEKEMGIAQAEKTLRHIIYYAEMKKQILKHCIL